MRLVVFPLLLTCLAVAHAKTGPKVCKKTFQHDRHPILPLCLQVTHKAWFDITIDGEPAGKIEIGLFGKTVSMFRAAPLAALLLFLPYDSIILN